MSRLLGLVGGISDRNHMWEICSIFRLFTSSAGSLGESHFKKKKISSSNTLAAARLWRGHRPLGVQKRKVHAPGYGYSGRQAWGGASTFPVVQLITVLLFIDFLSQNSTLKKKKSFKSKANSMKHNIYESTMVTNDTVFWSILHIGVCYWHKVVIHLNGKKCM